MSDDITNAIIQLLLRPNDNMVRIGDAEAAKHGIPENVWLAVYQAVLLSVINKQP